MSKRYIIEFYTSEPKPPEIYNSNSQSDMITLFEQIRTLTQAKAKFVILEAVDTLVDWS